MMLPRCMHDIDHKGLVNIIVKVSWKIHTYGVNFGILQCSRYRLQEILDQIIKKTLIIPLANGPRRRGVREFVECDYNLRFLLRYEHT